MRKPLVFLIFSLWLITTIATATECPSNLPKSCSCETVETGIRLKCLENSNINEIFNLLKNEIFIDKLIIQNCEPKVKELKNLPFLKIRSLTIENCGIEKIDADAFNNLGKDLEELRMIGNSLTTFPLLGILSKLQSINFKNNLIAEIPEHCFDGFSQLRQIRIENNKICSLLPNALDEIKPNLELLDLSGNCLSAVPAQTLRNSPKLAYLDLSKNKINELSKFSFMNLPMLKELRLNSNRLGILSPIAFMNVPILSHLLVKNNKLTSIESGALQVFKELEVVDLSGNEISIIPSFKDMPKLKSVHLNQNKIRRIETMTFSSNPALQIINLQDNEISLIARNSFDSLDQLVSLLLTNNSLPSIEKGVFDGMKNLQQLNIRNNSLVELTSVSLASLPKLNVADFGYNKITRIHPGTFDKHSNLFWLDLSNNNISSFEMGTFDKRIANILLDGNKLNCDEKFDWFLTYLVKNQVRTFLPSQPEIKCDGPEIHLGRRLKDLMIKKANETLTELRNNPTTSSNSGNNIFGNLFPGLIIGANDNRNGGGFSGPQSFPSPQNPGSPTSNGLSNSGMAAGLNPNNPNDLRQMLNSLPNFVVNIPGFGNIDLSKVPPPVLEHVLRGGQIPGIPRETLQQVVKQYTQRMYDVAANARATQTNSNQISNSGGLPTFSQNVVGPQTPDLDPSSKMKIIQNYYTSQFPVDLNNTIVAADGNPPTFNPQMFSMLKLLPPNYNLSRIPPEVITQLLHGEMPDFGKLPQDIIDYLRENSDKMFNSFKITANTSLEDILQKLPHFELPQHEVTFTPYDINKVDSNLVIKEEGWLTPTQTRILTGVALGFLATISFGILITYIYYLRKKRDIDSQMAMFSSDDFTATTTTLNRKGLYVDGGSAGFHNPTITNKTNASSTLRFDNNLIHQSPPRNNIPQPPPRQNQQQHSRSSPSANSDVVHNAVFNNNHHHQQQQHQQRSLNSNNNNISGFN